MPSPTRPRCTDGASARELLDAVAPALVEHDHDTLVHVVRHRRTVDVGLLPLEPGQAAVDHLIGASAPRDWHALGFVTGGTARALDAADEDPARAGCRVRLAVLADRTGAVASSVRVVGDGIDPARFAATVDEQPTGWVVDVVQRALGIATAPAEHDVGAWLDAIWLDSLLASLCAEPCRPWPWADLAALHPLQEDGPAPTPMALAERGRRAAAATTWARLRMLVAEGGDHDGVGPSDASSWLSPELAAWLDDGAFARHLVGRYPPADALLAALGDLLPATGLTDVALALTCPP